MSKSPKPTSGRMLGLDYLRGYFIIVIIVDHLNRWPSVLAVLSGRDALWVSAAEGFVMVSGLILGYVRGFKAREQSLRSVTFVVLRRAVTLYIWAVICTIILTIVTWYAPFSGPIGYVPIPPNDWIELFRQALMLQYTHGIIHFLYLYTVFLAVAPMAILLLRRKLWWVILVGSIVVWFIGVWLQLEFLQWQILFFIPAVVGFYLDSIRHRIARLAPIARTIGGWSIVGLTLVTMIISVFNLLPAAEPLFGRSPLGFVRVLLSGVWFAGFLIVINRILPWLKRYLGWLLGPFGTSSLTAYILHSIPLMLCSILFVQSDNIWINTLLGIGCILLTWGLMKIPFVQKVIPR